MTPLLQGQPAPGDLARLHSSSCGRQSPKGRIFEQVPGRSLIQDAFAIVRNEKSSPIVFN